MVSAVGSTSDLEVGGSSLISAVVSLPYSTLLLFSQVYKWVLAIIMLRWGGGGGGVTLGWTSIPSTWHVNRLCLFCLNRHLSSVCSHGFAVWDS